MSDAAALASRFTTAGSEQWHLLVRAITEHTADLTARLASAEGEITKTKDDRSYWAARCHENVLEAHALRDERDTLKAAVEQAQAALEEAYDLYDAGESAASAYERGDLGECRRQHDRAEGIKERMREALTSAAGLKARPSTAEGSQE